MSMSGLETRPRWTWPAWAIPQGPIILAVVNEQMSQYLEDQSSIVGYSHAAQDQSANENCDRLHSNGFDENSIAGNWRLGSAYVSTSHRRVDCEMLEGCGTEGSPI